MYDAVRRQIANELQVLKESNEGYYSQFASAWKESRQWATTQICPDPAAKLLVPYVGAGIDRMAGAGIGTWQDLVTRVATICGPLGTDYQIRRSRLTLPQQLELYLRGARKQPMNAAVRQAFRDAFGGALVPTSFHRRLVAMFPVLVTTNYTTLLSDSATPSRRRYDLTDPSEALPRIPPDHPAILHLHGVWDCINPGEEEDRIFAGVGLDDSAPGRCLVLSEHQYHRLYRHGEKFRKTVSELFGTNTLMLFLGAGLGPDESGLHAVLTERTIAGRQLAGIYVGLDLDPLTKRLLAIRGISAINLSREYGFGRDANETLFNALLDECEGRFLEQTTTTRLGAKGPSSCPDVLCIGLASLNRTFSLGKRRTIGTETSYQIDCDHFVEGPGGQHLYPALHLVSKGLKVALATAMGDDQAGDSVLGEVRSLVERLHHKGNPGDFWTCFITRAGSTRVTTGITFGGTRVIFDYDGAGGALPTLQRPIERWTDLKALYLGCYFLDWQERTLDELEDSVPLRFFETGTRSPPTATDWQRAVKIARRCTHVIASSEFLLRLSDSAVHHRERRTMACQAEVARDCRTNQELVRKAYANLWGSAGGALIVVMGGHGSAVIQALSDKTIVEVIKPVRVPTKQGKNWLGCGDLFRAEMIHQIVSVPSIAVAEAARNASVVVAKKIKRMQLLEDLP